MNYCTDYLGMTPKEALELFCQKHRQDGYATENGVIANCIKKYMEEDSFSKEEHEIEAQQYRESLEDLEAGKRWLKSDMSDLETRMDDLKREIIKFLDEKIVEFKEKVFEVDNK